MALQVDDIINFLYNLLQEIINFFRGSVIFNFWLPLHIVNTALELSF